MQQGRPVAVLGGVRIPFCRQNTAYADVGNLGMSVRTLGALVEKFGLHGQQLGEVAMGAVIKHPSDWNLGREATLSSGLSPLTPGHHPAARLRHLAGRDHHHRQQDRDRPDRGPASAAARTPPPTCRSCTAKQLRRRLLQAARAKTTRDKLAAFKGFHLRELKPDFPGVAEPRTGKSMGDHCEDMAKQWSISRDSQDELAAASHHKLAAAYERGFFDDLVVSFRGVVARQHPARRHLAGEAGDAEAGVRQDLRPRHADRRQLHAADRRRRRVPARRRTNGRARTATKCCATCATRRSPRSISSTAKAC